MRDEQDEDSQAEGTARARPDASARPDPRDPRDWDGVAGQPGGVGDGPDPPLPGAPPEGGPMERAQRLLGVSAPAFARRLREARQDKDWTRLELANRASVAPSTVGNLEREKSGNPDPVVALALALALGYESVAEFLGEASPKRPPVPNGPGPMTLERLVESLLRGVWAAQDARPAVTVAPSEASGGGTPGRGSPSGAEGVAAAGEAVARAAEASAATTSALQRTAGSGAVALSVGVVVLVEPRTVG